MTALPHAELNRATPINPNRLQELQADHPDLQIVDVRSGGEFQAAHIPGSHSIPLEVISEHAAQVATIDRPLVLVCQTGARASKACERLAASGAGPLYLLEGGVPGWQSAGFDVNRGESQRWAMDRQVRLVAGTIVSVAVAASAAVPAVKWIAAGIGAGLTYSALSNTCGMAAVLSKLPYNRDETYDFSSTLAKLNG